MRALRISPRTEICIFRFCGMLRHRDRWSNDGLSETVENTRVRVQRLPGGRHENRLGPGEKRRTFGPIRLRAGRRLVHETSGGNGKNPKLLLRIRVKFSNPNSQIPGPYNNIVRFFGVFIGL